MFLGKKTQTHVFSQPLTTNKNFCQPLAALQHLDLAVNRKYYTWPSFLLSQLTLAYPSIQKRCMSSVLIFYFKEYLTLYLTLYFFYFTPDSAFFSKIFSTVIDSDCTVNKSQLHIIKMILYLNKCERTKT